MPFKSQTQGKLVVFCVSSDASAAVISSKIEEANWMSLFGLKPPSFGGFARSWTRHLDYAEAEIYPHLFYNFEINYLIIFKLTSFIYKNVTIVSIILLECSAFILFFV